MGFTDEKSNAAFIFKIWENKYYRKGLVKDGKFYVLQNPRWKTYATLSRPQRTARAAVDTQPGLDSHMTKSRKDSFLRMDYNHA